MNTLRVYMNDEDAFFKVLKEFYQTYAYSIASTKSFIELAERHAGKKLDWFFKQYLYTSAAPILEYNTAMDYELGKKVLKFRYLNTEEDFVLPIKRQQSITGISAATHKLMEPHCKRNELVSQFFYHNRWC